MTTGTYILITSLNVNGLNAPTKRHRLAEWIQKQDPYICCLQETHIRPQDTYRLKVRGWKNIFHANGKQKKARIAILISDKVDLKIKITRDKEGHYNNDQGINLSSKYVPRFFVSSQQKFGVTDIEAPSAGHNSWRTDRVIALK